MCLNFDKIPIHSFNKKKKLVFVNEKECNISVHTEGYCVGTVLLHFFFHFCVFQHKGDAFSKKKGRPVTPTFTTSVYILHRSNNSSQTPCFFTEALVTPIHYVFDSCEEGIWALRWHIPAQPRSFQRPRLERCAFTIATRPRNRRRRLSKFWNSVRNIPAHC
jgi:hypothetical protein